MGINQFADQVKFSFYYSTVQLLLLLHSHTTNVIRLHYDKYDNFQLPEEMSCCGVRKPKKDGEDATAEV